MNYLTGLTLGISAGKQFGKLYRSPGFSLVHAIPGRRRYFHKKLINNSEFSGDIERELVSISALRSFVINQVTGTILLEYTCSDEQIDMMMTYLDHLSNKPDPNSLYGKVGTDIRRNAGSLNQAIKTHTNLTFDLRTIIALGMMFWGAQKVWTLGQRPNGPQLLWWSYSLLKGRDV